MSSINVYIQDVPTGDDYYVMFVNYTHGLLYTASNTFTISDSADASAPSPDASAPTVTISGAPNPHRAVCDDIATITGALLVSVLCGAFSVL
ncbi:hypothetical protein EVJ58_g1008 [Rhodofomes roseus]|uniref:Uncharacterized protein n=1 Tax=Rhodofomes roseus TaxID=34475 RepID=A0A4Y9Z3I3_9APHY|nr:hypothetical protein EVJ58_g1008 [Rhodofomes roseus]